MATDPTFAEVIENYLADCHRRGLRPATIHYYETALGRFTRATEARRLSDFDRDRVRTFQDSSPTLSGNSMRGYLRALRTFSMWLADEDLTESDRLAKLRLPRVDQRLRLVPTDAELRRLITAAPVHLRVLIVLMAGTGLRVSDVESLELDDLRGDDLVVQTTKNRRGRLVVLDPALGALLQTYTVDCRRQPHRLHGQPLFVNRTGSRVTAGGTRQALDHAKRFADLQIPVSPHILRHWFARDLAAHGITDRLLAARMGWTSSTLQSRYAPVTETELRDDVARYAPVTRLHAAGLLDGLLPIGRRRNPTSAIARSNRFTGASGTGRSGAPRQS